MRRCRKARTGIDRALDALCNHVERCIGCLENTRRVAVCYDKSAKGFLGSAELNCIRLWIGDFANTPRMIALMRSAGELRTEAK